MERNTSYFEGTNPLKMSKDHSKKQYIMDVAIQKVPYIKYPGVSDYGCQVLQEFSKETLRIAKEENDSNEVALVLSLADIESQTKPTFGVVFGDEHNVDPEDSVESYHLLHSVPDCILVILHNHPAGATFSIMDITNFIRLENVKLMLVITNYGNIFYLLKTDRYNYEAVSTLSHAAITAGFAAHGIKEQIAASNIFLHSCHTAGVVYGHS